MIIRYRIFLLIHILCYAAIIHGISLDANDAETCNLLCVQCNASTVFANSQCECKFADDSDKVAGAECIRRIEREIQAIEQNMLSEDLTDEQRNVRSLLKYRHRLRPGDAEKVARYFVDGGPAAGHSHFLRAFNAAYDSADSATNSFSGVVDESNPENGFHGASLTSPVSSNTYDSPLYMVSEFAPYASPMQGVEMYPSTLRAANPAIAYPISGLYDPTNPLGSIVHPHPVRTLVRAATLPAHILHHVLHPRMHYPRARHRGIVKSSNSPPDDTSNPAIVSQPACENNDDSTTSDVPTARNNPNEPAEQNVSELTAPSQYPYITHAWYQPAQYQQLPYQYTSLLSPLMNVLHPITNSYILQPIPQSTSDPLTSASNPQPFCGNNANAEQRNRVLTTDKAVYSNDETEKSNDATRNNIPTEEKRNKNGINKS